MSTFERIKELAKKQGKSLNKVEEDLGYGKNVLYRLKNSKPSAERLKELANYFDVSVDYLLGRTEKRRYYDLNEKEKNDIAIQAEKLLEGLDSDTEINFYGEPLDDEDKEKLYDAIQLALSLTQVKAKKKFTPKKYRQ
ncbi:helix-turn-helix domain-containing protein [Enterococcus faecalis]|uniref:helix-turn-helix domain-containing protein n=1 Tax=Enterococcus faecalis TaxID=1351 RepID=UPI00192135F7|nr:helix-turn-helix transcriptional regulator [Enterococcus faecalis]EGO7983256.1 helix-turn-helix transcriptional regulator [Enterococcus faecalis]EJR1551036.1 helix-turn-helix transcriptional regulator [Enterococcus faecalis]EJY7246286.1 helix-turn-helix transcriptional regulator [Enterococcus faecalis]EKE4871660.1 helix-turn-helix transcriptional regulator [Enterococcus faecalis]EKZ0465616.1 helix-turn-helix transcriptional regulator [Enterococcus faecalis]